ncbi:MAG: rod shape-determining protein MreD [Lactobacillales bacterium]|jgi:rod shape-determining protein MreD|nr:rod shape-determining protein MreD [Lactobacillales bacterium]
MTDRFARLTISFLFLILSFVCLLIDQLPYFMIPYFNVHIPFIIIVVFYFAIFHPTVMNSVLAFFIGLMADMITNSPLGLQAFLFSGLFFFTNLNRKFLLQRTFSGLWIYFTISALIYYIVWYVLFSLKSLTLLNIMPLMVQYVFVVLFYPIVVGICGSLNNKLGEKL